MVYIRCVFEDAFTLQIHELSMDFVGNESGKSYLTAGGYPGVNIDNKTTVISSTYSLDLNPKIEDIM